MGLPISFILKSKLPRIQKLGLIVLFTLGFIIIGISVVRIISLNNEDRHPSLSWKVFWGSIENAVAIMTSCFASFKSLITLRRRPSMYPYAPGRGVYEMSGTRSRNHDASHNHTFGGDFDFPLVSRLKKNRDKSHGAPAAGDETWGDGESGKQILHRTEIEVKFDSRSMK